MDFLAGIFSTNIFNWIVMPLLIFLSRVFDVSFGTMRVVFVSQGFKRVASVLSFFEVILWVLVARQILTGLNNYVWMIAYAAGYATGTYFGVCISEKFNNSKIAVRVIVTKDYEDIIEELKENDFGVTVIDSHGNNGKTKILYSVIKSKDLTDVLKIINKYNKKAFYSIESIKSVNEGIFREQHNYKYIKKQLFPMFSKVNK